MTQLLTVEGVSKAFPGVQALADVGFDLGAGEVLALIGENGAGKSTLMKILAGTYTADSGSIVIDGAPVQITHPRQAQELGISIIHQELNLMPHLTVAQNIFIGREPRYGPFLAEGRLVARTRDLLDRLGLTLDPNATVDRLPVAAQQLVEIAKALSYPNTRILIMDEPTSAISEADTQGLFTLIRGLQRTGVGVVYISHRMAELRQIADRATVLRDGRQVGTHRLDEVSDSEIIRAMVGRDLPDPATADSPTDQAPAPGQEPTPRTAPDRDPVLEVRGLSTPDLIRDVSFELYPGEILGFAGLIGAGRTEVARAIIGADRRSTGSIMINGRPVSVRTPAQAVRHGISYLPEDRKRHGLMLDQSVQFNTVLASLPQFTRFGFTENARTRRVVRDAVSALRVKTPSIDAPVRNLSGGNQQKVVIAKWLARQCDVLIFDEPTRGIDVGAKQEIYQLLTDLVGQGKSVIVISSELPEVLRLSDRIVVMSQGRITGLLDRSEADSETIMELATRNVSSFEEGSVA
ncbi:sugar ABC transporter ATP-binding protein [Microlunatus soli]|uniref:Monosaccharide ABC transporter ATP-binding protein, CUT2 family n=1 Tax=Microlunatus soli TaxID=630515 RepID=A0A1H2AK20_9ACTN|nr:sugar ABC transporter ATP-binding protein [Microlunatus soli]SDT46365.1 monosaccharide ABC transporter ATP-binding protein, CUT2 family [Microlunatus soli]